MLLVLSLIKQQHSLMPIRPVLFHDEQAARKILLME